MTAEPPSPAAGFLLALQFLTRVPAPRIAYTPEAMTEAARYFPAVGALVGGVGAAIFPLAALALPMIVAALLAIAVTTVMTGALHEDGLADSFDGLAAGSNRERALAIMRDSWIGAYGVLALVLVLALRAGTLAAMPAGIAAPVLVAGAAVSRLSCVVAIATGRYARVDGAGSFTTHGLSSAGLTVALATGVLCLAGLAVVAGAGIALAAGAAAVAGHLLARGIFEPRLGGYTGDTLGALQQVTEVAIYLAVLAWL
jgi:adenosylcobinamide-GDP ribazoletransferase